MSDRIIIQKQTSCIGELYWMFAIVYTFMKWGFWWGVLSFILPIFPIIDLIKYIFK
jgi:hypothetical protein